MNESTTVNIVYAFNLLPEPFDGAESKDLLPSEGFSPEPHLQTAGKRLLKLIHILNVNNLLIAVSIQHVS